MSEVDLNSTPVCVRTTPEQRRRAGITVARNARDAQDCRELLDMLGLLGQSQTERARHAS